MLPRMLSRCGGFSEQIWWYRMDGGSALALSLVCRSTGITQADQFYNKNIFFASPVVCLAFLSPNSSRTERPCIIVREPAIQSTTPSPSVHHSSYLKHKSLNEEKKKEQNYAKMKI